VVGDVYGVLPFGNTCVVRKVTGALLWQVMEKSVGANLGSGGFLQIAGFKVEYSPEAAAGSRLLKMTLLDGNRDIPRDDTTEYTAVTNDFTNTGGDGYGMLRQPTASPSLEVMADVVVDYLKAKATLSPADYSGRIVPVAR
jgi:2',3'-cyclic-nucleotide 2'-phosphodiesterase (5'-nucleotidase family)